tara:strand:+ start:1218 stop:1439 length:222 start_codon:yes stop_codon:yes gene_type:complete
VAAIALFATLVVFEVVQGQPNEIGVETNDPAVDRRLVLPNWPDTLPGHLFAYNGWIFFWAEGDPDGYPLVRLK